MGPSAAAAVAPSKTFRREMFMAMSFVDRQLSMKRAKVTVKPQCTAAIASKHGKRFIPKIGHKHQSGRMRDRERHLGGCDHRLRRHATGPEHRNFVGLYRHWIAVVGFGEIGDAD